MHTFDAYIALQLGACVHGLRTNNRTHIQRVSSTWCCDFIFELLGKRRSPRVGRDDNLYVEGAHERTRQRSTPHCASGSAASSSHLTLEMGGRAVFRICEVRCAAIWRRHSASTCARRDCNLLVRVACAAIWRRRSASTCARVSIHGYIGCNSASGRRSSAYGLPSEVRAVLKRTFAVRELAVMTVHSQPRPCCSEHR